MHLQGSGVLIGQRMWMSNLDQSATGLLKRWKWKKKASERQKAAVTSDLNEDITASLPASTNCFIKMRRRHAAG